MVDGFRKASFASRLKIPIIYGLDVVHGAGPVYGATVFPHNIGLGATRNPALVEEVAGIVAEEAAGVGADFPFAPVVAVARDERWGRTYESFGETVELASAMGVAYTNGFQKRSGRVHRARQRQALPGRRRHRQRGERRQHLGRRGGAARAAPRPLPGRRQRRRRLDHGLVQQLAGDAHARQHGDDHRRAQGRSRLPRLRRLRLQRLLPERGEPRRLSERRRRHVHDLRAQRLAVPVDGARAGPGHRAPDAHRRRRPAHPGGQVRDGPARRREPAGRPFADGPGGLGRAPRGGPARGGGVAGRAQERRRDAAAGQGRRGRRAGRQDRRQRRQPVRRLDGDLAGDERRRHHGHHGPPGAGGGRPGTGLLRAGWVGDRQRRGHGGHRGHRRDAVLGGVRRHPDARGRHCA